MAIKNDISDLRPDQIVIDVPAGKKANIIGDEKQDILVSFVRIYLEGITNANPEKIGLTLREGGKQIFSMTFEDLLNNGFDSSEITAGIYPFVHRYEPITKGGNFSMIFKPSPNFRMVYMDGSYEIALFFKGVLEIYNDDSVKRTVKVVKKVGTI